MSAGDSMNSRSANAHTHGRGNGVNSIIPSSSSSSASSRRRGALKPSPPTLPSPSSSDGSAASPSSPLDSFHVESTSILQSLVSSFSYPCFYEEFNDFTSFVLQHFVDEWKSYENELKSYYHSQLLVIHEYWKKKFEDAQAAANLETSSIRLRLVEMSENQGFLKFVGMAAVVDEVQNAMKKINDMDDFLEKEQVRAGGYKQLIEDRISVLKSLESSSSKSSQSLQSLSSELSATRREFNEKIDKMKLQHEMEKKMSGEKDKKTIKFLQDRMQKLQEERDEALQQSNKAIRDTIQGKEKIKELEREIEITSKERDKQKKTIIILNSFITKTSNNGKDAVDILQQYTNSK